MLRFGLSASSASWGCKGAHNLSKTHAHLTFGATEIVCFMLEVCFKQTSHSTHTDLFNKLFRKISYITTHYFLLTSVTFPFSVYTSDVSVPLMEGGEGPFLSTKRLPLPDPGTLYSPVEELMFSNRLHCHFSLHLIRLPRWHTLVLLSSAQDVNSHFNAGRIWLFISKLLTLEEPVHTFSSFIYSQWTCNTIYMHKNVLGSNLNGRFLYHFYYETIKKNISPVWLFSYCLYAI